MKRFLWLIAAVALVVCMAGLPAETNAAETVKNGSCGDNLTWTLDSEGTLTISGTGMMNHWRRPDENGYYNSNPLAPWNEYREVIRNVVIESGVTSIGSAAFAATSLETVSIADTVTSIGSNAFYSCAFLTEVTIPECVAIVGNSAFRNCTGLKSVSVCANTKNISRSTFADCPNLEFSVYDKAKYVGNESNPYEILVTASDMNLTGCTIHPDTKLIATGAFREARSLRNISIPNKVTEIGAGAFAHCTLLTNVTIPGNVSTIGDTAFYNCALLRNLTLPEGLERIGDSAFYGCDRLTNIILPKSLKYLGTQAFFDCEGLLGVSIPDSLPEVGVSMFDECTKLYHTTYEGTKYLGNPGNPYLLLVSATSTDITQCQIHPDTKFIDGRAFIYCTKLQEIVIPDKVISLEFYGFFGCTGLETVVLSKSMTCIRGTMFFECTNLKSITIPESIVEIQDLAFWKCDSLTDVYYGGSEQQWAQIVIEAQNEALTNATIHYAKHSHCWDDGTITQPATCKNEGIKTFTCTCGETRTEPMELTGHTPGDPATAVKDQICTVCGIVLDKATGETQPTMPPTEETAPPTEETVPPTVPPTEATEPPAEETVPPTTAATEPATEPTTQPSTQPETTPSLVPTEATEPATVPTVTPTEPTDPGKAQGNSYIWVIALVAAVLLGGGSAVILLKKKK